MSNAIKEIPIRLFKEDFSWIVELIDFQGESDSMFGEGSTVTEAFVNLAHNLQDFAVNALLERFLQQPGQPPVEETNG